LARLEGEVSIAPTKLLFRSDLLLARMVKRGQKVIVSVEESLPRPGHKRARVEDPIAEKVAAIAKALADPEVETPGALSCREMLQAMLPCVLRVPCSERHSYQATVASMIGEVLKTSQESCEQKVHDAHNTVETAEREHSSLVSAFDVSNQQLQSQQSEVKSCKEQENVHAEAEKEAEKVAREADKEVFDFDSVQLSKAKDLEECNSIYKDNFEVLKSATEPLSAKDQKTHISALMALVKKLGADVSLRTAIPVTFKKVPAERGTFDGVVVDQVDALLKDHAATLKTALDNGDTVKAEKIEMQTQAQKALDSAKETHRASKEATKTACEMLVSRQSEVKSAQTAVCSKKQELATATDQHAHNKTHLEQATDLFSAFTYLLERDVVPDPVPEVSAEKVEEVVTAAIEEQPTMMEDVAVAVEPTAMQMAIAA